jgi:hypothetical protein
VLKDASLLVDVVVTQAGYTGRTVTVDVEDDGRIVGSEQVRLPDDGSPATVRVRAAASEPGPRLFKFRVAPLPDEVVTQNNVRETLINVRDVREKILYFEGEPRFEMKFLRRAVDEDKNLQVVSLQRTADNKFMRLGVDGPDELVGGFPKTREELFSYRAIILGSIEAGAFSAIQLQMIADFVDRRGGEAADDWRARSFGEAAAAERQCRRVAAASITRVGTGGAGAAADRCARRSDPCGGADCRGESPRSRWRDLPQVTA